MSVIAKVSTCDFRFPTSATFSGSDAMNPEELVATLDFRYLTDALTAQEAIDILRAAQEGKAERIAHLKEVGYPGYSTAAGWRAVGKIQRSMCKIRRSI